MFGDLLNLDARAIYDEPNPCRKAYGPGPSGKRCKHCAHIVVFVHARRYYKCDMRHITSGSATDHRVNWAACGKFKVKKSS